VLYPGFIPKMGDLFIYDLQPGQLGIFKVNQAPARLTIKSGTSHTVQFELIKLLNTEELDEILERVRDEAWFDKQRFLNETAALLTSDDMYDLDYMKQKFAELLHYFHTTFYDKLVLKSYSNDEDLYDPYLVDFMKSFISMEEIDNDFIDQLYPDALLSDNSFWKKLREPKLIDWSNYVGDAYNSIYQTDAVSYRITSLINRPYVVLADDTTDTSIEYYPYISENIGGIDMELFDTFDTLIAFYMEYQVIDVDLLVELIDDIYNVEKSVQFYQIPVILYFIRLLERSIHTGNSIKLAKPEQLPYLHVPFEQPSDAMVGDLLTVISPNSKVIGILDNESEPIYPDVLDITYIPEGFTIDLAPIKAENGIVGDLPHEPDGWRVIISNEMLIIL